MGCSEYKDRGSNARSRQGLTMGLLGWLFVDDKDSKESSNLTVEVSADNQIYYKKKVANAKHFKLVKAKSKRRN
jgi:hypothetical protein